MKRLVLCCCAFLSAAAAVRAADWTDRKEYDLVLTIRSESSPEKRLALLDTWSKSYPQTALAHDRRELYLSTYDSMGDKQQMFGVARQMLAAQPDNPVGLYWLTVLAPQQTNANTEIVDAGDKAAHQLLASTKNFFAPDKKPANLSEADWQKQETSVEVLAQRTEGWANWQRGNFAAASDDLSACLKKDPGNAEVSSWLGIVYGLDTNKQAQAIWHLARASNKELSTPLPDEQRRQVNGMLETVYISYHGSLEGLDQIRKLTASNAFPPAEFAIDPATVVNARRAEAELSQTNPELAAWLAMRRQLEDGNGDKYFASDLQGKPLPQLSGVVLHAVPPRAPTELTVSMTEATLPDITIKLTVPMTSAVHPGVKISFQGTGDSFTKNPFTLVMRAESVQVVNK
jgi:hypothetical protein